MIYMCMSLSVHLSVCHMYMHYIPSHVTCLDTHMGLLYIYTEIHANSQMLELSPILLFREKHFLDAVFLEPKGRSQAV